METFDTASIHAYRMLGKFTRSRLLSGFGGHAHRPFGVNITRTNIEDDFPKVVLQPSQGHFVFSRIPCEGNKRTFGKFFSLFAFVFLLLPTYHAVAQTATFPLMQTLWRSG